MYPSETNLTINKNEVTINYYGVQFHSASIQSCHNVVQSRHQECTNLIMLNVSLGHISHNNGC